MADTPTDAPTDAPTDVGVPEVPGLPSETAPRAKPTQHKI